MELNIQKTNNPIKNWLRGFSGGPGAMTLHSQAVIGSQGRELDPTCYSQNLVQPNK